jgi:hypothetical protein
MLASILIIAISTLLFLYWFRYTCILILSTKTSKDYTRQVAAANQLRFVEVQGALREPSEVASLDQLERALDRDYHVVSYLLRQTEDLEIEGETSGMGMEQHMLRLDFHAMRLWYRLSRRVSDSAARGALHEMSMVVGHLANAFGEQAELSARA